MQQVSKEYQYEVVTVEKTSPPEGLDGDNWYRYVIKSGNSVMDCKKSGTLKAVKTHAKEMAEMINNRNGRGGQSKSAKK